MTKQAALLEFFSSFGIDAYPNTAVTDDAALPYLTYEVKSASFGGLPVPIIVKLYYYTDSEAIPSKKAEEISRFIGEEGAAIRCDDGLIMVYKGDPFCINLEDETDSTIKLRYINLVLKFYTF